LHRVHDVRGIAVTGYGSGRSRSPDTKRFLAHLVKPISFDQLHRARNGSLAPP